MRIYTESVSVWDAAQGRYVSDDAASRWFEHDGPVAECKKGGKRPKTPDPAVVSDLQTQSNQQTAAYNAALNRVNTYTPQGSSVFSQTGTDASGAPIYEQRVTLTPDAQALYEQQQAQSRQLGTIAGGMMDSIGSTYSRPVDTSAAPKLFGADDLLDARQQTQDALYNRQAAYLDPQWAQRDTAFRSQMANQGIVEGSEAWRNALDDESRARSFDYAQARNDSILAGQGEMTALSDLSRGNRAQTLNEIYTARAQPLNEFNALRSASQVDMPQFDGAAQSNMANTDVAGNYWNAFDAQMAKYNAAQQGANNLMSGVFGLGSAVLSNPALKFSDERLKENIEPIGALPDGTMAYEYSYRGDPTRHAGVMAQEVERTQPGAVVTHPSGYKMVDYAQVLARAMGARHAA